MVLERGGHGAGPAPKPTALRILQGNLGKLPINEHEPIVRPVIDKNLKPPKHLWPDAKWLWKRVILELKACGLLTHLDLETLEVYCQAYAVYRAADRELRKHGLIFKYWEKGKIKGEQAHAAWTIERQAWLLMNRYGQDLGLSPAARTRIQVFKSKQEDSDERLFG